MSAHSYRKSFCVDLESSVNRKFPEGIQISWGDTNFLGGYKFLERVYIWVVAIISSYKFPAGVRI